MTAGACPTCRSPLRWLPDLRAWSCDLCRVTFAPDDKEGTDPKARAKPRDKRVYYGAGAGAVVGVGIALAFVVRGGAKKPTVEDRDKLVRDAFAELAAGDTTKIAGKLCDGADWRAGLERAAARAHGATYEVVKIEERAGGVIDAIAGCKLDGATPHLLDVDLRITRAGKPRDAHAKLTVAETHGEWSVLDAPRIVGCDTAVGHVAQVGASDASANRAQEPMVERCQDDAWSAVVVECLTQAGKLDDVSRCLKDLTPEQSASLAKAVQPIVGDKGALHDAIVPAQPTTAPEISGAAEQAPVGDFWIWPLSDGWFLVTSPLLDIAFPHKPKIVVERPAVKTANGNSLDIYTLSDEPAGVTFTLEPLGAGAKLTGTKYLEDTKQRMAKLGKVTETHHQDGAVTFTELSADGSGKRMRVQDRDDTAHGVMTTAATLAPIGDANADRFLASIHLRQAVDTTASPQTLAKVAAKKAGKSFVVHEPAGGFEVTLPFAPRITRKPASANPRAVTVEAVADKKAAHVTFEVQELAPWEALRFTPAALADLDAQDEPALEKQVGGKLKRSEAELGGLLGSRLDPIAKKPKHDLHRRMVWNRYQHRLYQIVCSGVACDPIAQSLKFAPATPVK
jgi:hypothetical protein